MFKSMLVFVFSLSLLALSGCSEKQPVAEPTAPADTVLSVPAGTQLVNIECGQPCILVWAPYLEQYVALLADGRTITVVFDE